MDDQDNHVEKGLQKADNALSNLTNLLGKQLNLLERIHERISTPTDSRVVDEWKIVARVVDRLCLVLFFLIQCCGFIAIFCKIIAKT